MYLRCVVEENVCKRSVNTQSLGFSKYPVPNVDGFVRIYLGLLDSYYAVAGKVL